MAEKLYFDSSTANNLDAVAKTDPNAATSDQVKSNHLYRSTVTGEVKIGEMPMQPSALIKIDPSTESASENNSYTIPKGYHDGTGKVYVGNLEEYTYGTATPEDVLNNKTFWVKGEKKVGTLNKESLDQAANATSKDIVDGATAWVNGEKVLGSIPKLPRKDQNLLCGESYTIPYGLSAGTTIVSSASLSSQTPGDASSGDIAKGRIAWVNGKKIIGTSNINADTAEALESTNTLQSHVLFGKRFYSNIYGQVLEGRMPDHTGEPERTLSMGDTFNIPYGYYDGNTKIITKSLQDSTLATAKPENILINKSAWVNGEKIIGTMDNNLPSIKEIAAGKEYVIPKGYHSGNGKVVAKGMAAQTPGTALSSDITEGKSAWVNGEKIIGTMQDNIAANIEITPGGKYYIPEGHHSGSGNVYVKSLSSFTNANATPDDLLEGKSSWVNGKKIYGVIRNVAPVNALLKAGETFEVPVGHHSEVSTIQALSLKNQTPGDALSLDIFEDKVAWVNGNRIVGTMKFNGTAKADDVLYGTSFYNTNPREIVQGTLKFNASATENDVIEGVSFYNTDPKRKKTGSLKLTGSSTSDNVLEGTTFYNTDPRNKVTGTMPNIGRVSKIINADTTYTIPKGYHDGTGTVSAEGLGSQTPGTATSGDILEGTDAWINGEKVTGTLKLTGTATSEEVLPGFTFYNNSAKQKLNGSMYVAPPSIYDIKAGEEFIIPKGYHTGEGKVIAKALDSQTDGTAKASDILYTKTAWVNGKKTTGIMPNNNNWSKDNVASGDVVVIPEGYHDGNGLITTQDLASQTPGNATSDTILIGKNSWVNGAKIEGSMPDNTGWTEPTALAGITYTIPKGYHDGTGFIKVEAIEKQTPGDATSNDILSPKTAWANGQKLTGTIITHNTNKIRISAGNTYTIPAGYYPDGITLYSLYDDRLDLTGTDAYVLNSTLYPESAGTIQGDSLVVTPDHGLEI